MHVIHTIPEVLEIYPEGKKCASDLPMQGLVPAVHSPGEPTTP